jgi:hypothetical protein
MSVIGVKTGHGRTMNCVIGSSGRCKYCDRPIIWATTPREKPIPLEPWPTGAGETESHFAHCSRRLGSEPPLGSRPIGQVRGVEMTQEIWRHLLLLVHPDKHHGGEVEQLANDVTRWLLQQRGRLTGD